MAHRNDRNRWLLNAEDACGVDQTAAQIIWLRAKRAEYAALVDSGDWATTDVGGEGGTSKSARNKSDEANHDAIIDALRYLGATDLGSTGSMMIPQFQPVLG